MVKESSGRIRWNTRIRGFESGNRLGLGVSVFKTEILPAILRNLLSLTSELSKMLSGVF